MFVSRHHAVWQKRHYKTPVERAFREHEGLVIPILDEVHKELHQDLFPPQKPSRETMLGVLDFLQNKPLSGPLDGVLFTIDYLEHRESKDACRLSEHLYQQLGYLMLGVERVEV